MGQRQIFTAIGNGQFDLSLCLRILPALNKNQAEVVMGTRTTAVEFQRFAQMRFRADKFLLGLFRFLLGGQCVT